MYQREKKLKEQLAELQIIIDGTKRQKQVQEITESDLFHDLQEKARALRSQKEQEESAE